MSAKADDDRARALLQWVTARQGEGGVRAITADTDLVASGALDSLGLVSLFFLVETMRGEPVDFEEATATGPLTISAIVDRWLGAG